MTLSIRVLLAASLCLAPLGWAAAQDQPRDEQRQREQKEQQQQRTPQQPQLNQPQQHTAPQPGNTAPQGKGPGPSGQQFQRPAQNNAAPSNPQTFQRPAQNNVAPPPGVQTFQRPPLTNAAPAGSTASPPPPPGQSQFGRVQQGTPQTGGAPPSGSSQQQQFQQRSVQRGGAPTGSVTPQVSPQQQQTTTFRGNFQGGNRSTNTAAFAQRHAGAAPTQFSSGRFYGRDFAHFTPRESTLWRGGAWRHEFHDGRFGWWYAVDGIWYFYDEPIYPYPTFIPDVVYIPEDEYAYDDDAPADAAAPGQNGVFYANGMYYYYYCPALQTYYPYVGTCPSPWQTVPATSQ